MKIPRNDKHYFIDSIEPFDYEGRFVARLLNQENDFWGNRYLYIPLLHEDVDRELVEYYRKEELPARITGRYQGLHDGMFIKIKGEYITAYRNFIKNSGKNFLYLLESVPLTKNDYEVESGKETQNDIKQGVNNNLKIKGKNKKCKPELFCFDVGQGDMAVFISSENHAYVIDTCIRSRYADQKLSNLKKILRDREIEALIVTHRHSDHYCGAYRLFDKFKVNNLIVNASFVQSFNPFQVNNLFQKARKNHAKIICPHFNESFIDGNTMLNFSMPTKCAANENANSMVVEALYEKKLYSLTGDADADYLEKISSPVADEIVLKVSHHGSKTGTSKTFLSKFDACKKKKAFISVGRNNPYHHPNALCGFLLNGKGFDVDASTSIHAPYKKY